MTLTQASDDGAVTVQTTGTDVVVTEGAGTSSPQISNISRSGADVTITWANGGTLYWTGVLAGAATQWTTTGDSDGSFTEAPPGTRFYRVQR